MISLDIDLVGDKEMAAAFAEYPKRATRAMVRALNRAIVGGRTLMVKEIARDTGLKSGDVRKALTMREATASRPEARLAASLKRIPLIAFNARGPEPSRGQGRGVSYRLRGSKGRIPSAFIATMASGHKGVFARVPGKGRHGPAPMRSQLPIRELFGPSLGHVFGKYRPAGIARARAAFESNFAHEMGWQASAGAD